MMTSGIVKYCIALAVALSSFTLASAQTKKPADMILYEGMVAYHQGDFGKANNILSQRDLILDIQAMEILGLMHLPGQTYLENPERAYLNLKWASDRGSARASTLLGLLYDFGDGVRQDKAKALELYRRGASLGDAEGYSNVAFAYQEGEAVAQSDVQACINYREGLLRDPDQLLVHEILADYYLAGACLPAPEHNVVHLYRKSILMGVSTAEDKLQALEAKGYDMSPDVTSCDHAKKNLGVGYPQDPKTFQNGRLFLAVGLATEDACSEYVAGFLYLYGARGYDPDPTEAIRLLKASAGKGYRQAIDLLPDAIKFQSAMTEYLAAMEVGLSAIQNRTESIGRDLDNIEYEQKMRQLRILKLKLDAERAAKN